VISPDFFNVFAAGLRVGAGYRWRSDFDNGAVVASTFTFGVRLPIKAHEEVILGVYADARVLLAPGEPTELTTGIEIDPVGLVAGIYEKVRWQGPPR
jgi:hypothetical protein